MPFEKNEELLFYDRKPNLFSISGFIYQTLAFMISFIEMRKFDLMADFLEQHTLYFFHSKKFLVVKDFFQNVALYIEQKPQNLKENNSNLIIFVCLFGLIPQDKNNLLKSDFFDMIYKILENLSTAKGFCYFYNRQPKIIKETFIKGCVYLFLLEEINKTEKKKESLWISILDDDVAFSRLENFSLPILNEITNLVDKYGLSISFSQSDFAKLQKFNQPKILLFSCDFLEFLNTLRLFLLKEFSKGQQINQIKEMIPKNLQGENFDLYSKFNENNNINKICLRYLEINAKSFQNLEIISKFMSIYKQLPDYLSVMLCIKVISKEINAFLQGKLEIIVAQDKFLENMQNILIISYDSLLLNQIDRVCYIKMFLEIKKNWTASLLSEYFRIFLLEDFFDLNDYCKILKIWIKKFIDKNNFVKILDSLVGAFDPLKIIVDVDSSSIHLLFKKKQRLLEACFTNFDSEDLKKSLHCLIKSVKSNEVTERFKQEYLNKIINSYDFNHSTSDKDSNPLNHLEDLYKSYGDSEIVIELIKICVSRIKLPDREDILTTIFIKPKKGSSTYKILINKYIFLREEQKPQLNKVLLSIVQDFESDNIEIKYIQINNEFQNDKIKIGNEILLKIQDLINPEKEKNFDILELVKKKKIIYDSKMLILDEVSEVIRIYCSMAKNYNEINKNLIKIRDSLSHIRLKEFVLDIQLENFHTYASLLKPCRNLESFLTFKENMLSEFEKNYPQNVLE